VLQVVAEPEPAPERQRTPRQPDPPPVVTRRLKRLTKVRDAVASELAIEPGLLCSKAALLELASHEPRCATADELAAAGLGGWRRQVLEDGFIDALATE
jgi:ribonuclease D